MNFQGQIKTIPDFKKQILNICLSFNLSFNCIFRLNSYDKILFKYFYLQSISSDVGSRTASLMHRSGGQEPDRAEPLILPRFSIKNKIFNSGKRCNTKAVRRRCGPNADCADTKTGVKCICHPGTFRYQNRVRFRKIYIQASK